MTTLPKLFRTAIFRSAVLLSVLFAVAAGLTIVYVYRNTASLLDVRLSETLLAETRGLAEQFHTGGITRLAAVIERRVQLPGNRIYLVTDSAGGWIAGNVRTLSRELWQKQGPVAFEYQRADLSGMRTRHAVANIYATAGGYRLMVGRDVEDQREIAFVFRNAVLTGLAFMVLFGVGGGLVVSHNLLRRIDRVSATSRAIMRGDLSERVPIEGTGDEIDRLSLNLNAMLERIEQLMNGLQEVSDNIAHDLKTPLSRLRSRIETSLRDGDPSTYRAELERTIEESDELIRIFNALLSIARLEAGSAQGRFSRLDVHDILRDVAELYGPLAEEEGMAFSATPGEPGFVRGDRQLIGQALANLLDNAIKYGRPADPAVASAIRLSAECDGQDCHIYVGDNGPGIAARDRAHAMKRFGRLERSRSRPGTGLGLSLVAAVARLHGGELMLEDNRPGLRARIRIPLDPAPGSLRSAAGQSAGMPM